MPVGLRFGRGGPATRTASRLLCPVLAAVAIAAHPEPVLADTTVSIGPTSVWCEWQGWGSSLCWWANKYGTRDDMADVLYTRRTVAVASAVGTHVLPGLGFNIARYNAGGTGIRQLTIDGRLLTPDNPKSLAPFKAMTSYWGASAAGGKAELAWDWTVDSSQRAMMLKARKRGANIFELFSNSPPWWMCRNLGTTGSSSGRDDNIAPGHEHDFAVYLAIVAQQARDHWGIGFQSIEPFNEPSANWWKSPGAQEGCYFDAATQSTVVRELRSELDQRD